MTILAREQDQRDHLMREDPMDKVQDITISETLRQIVNLADLAPLVTNITNQETNIGNPIEINLALEAVALTMVATKVDPTTQITITNAIKESTMTAHKADEATISKSASRTVSRDRDIINIEEQLSDEAKKKAILKCKQSTDSNILLFITSLILIISSTHIYRI